jgi:hypothetical protein
MGRRLGHRTQEARPGHDRRYASPPVRTLQDTPGDFDCAPADARGALRPDNGKR